MKVENARLIGKPAIVESWPGSCWTGVWRAAKATAATILNRGNRKASTPLRWLAAIAIEDALRRRGRTLRVDQREAVLRLMELGAQLNNRFDGDPIDEQSLLEDANWLDSSAFRDATRNYLKELYQLERQRPKPSADLAAIVDYRESVNLVSLAVLWTAATGRSLGPCKALFRGANEDLNLLFRLVMLSQIIDDLLDRKVDYEAGIPSLSGLKTHDLRSLAKDYAHADFRLDQLFPQKLAIKGAGLLVGVLLLVFRNRDNAS